MQQFGYFEILKKASTSFFFLFGSIFGGIGMIFTFIGLGLLLWNPSFFAVFICLFASLFFIPGLLILNRTLYHAKIILETAKSKVEDFSKFEDERTHSRSEETGSPFSDKMDIHFIFRLLDGMIKNSFGFLDRMPDFPKLFEDMQGTPSDTTLEISKDENQNVKVTFNGESFLNPEEIPNEKIRNYVQAWIKKKEEDVY